MKIFDCFMYFNENAVLDLRLNHLNEFVDYFVIVESLYNHKGESKNLNFDINKFKKFERKIRYLILDQLPKNTEIINKEDSENEKSRKYILNGYKRDHFQRNYIMNGIKDADFEDMILISDIDEIPNLDNVKLKSIKSKLIFFNQKMCYYKFNLYQESYNWAGSRGCKKKNLLSPQWLRDIKAKHYAFWRLDAFFSKKKYTNIHFVNDGGWHFSYLGTPEGIEKKLKSYTHHREYELNPIGISKIRDRIKNKESVYNLNVDQRTNQFDKGVKLSVLGLNQLPKYIGENLNKYKEWLED